jgi:hypothetical protein
MKTRVATALSLAGVLCAGSAAALVNVKVLGSGQESSIAAAPAVTNAAPSTTLAPEISVVQVTAPTTTAAPTTTVAVSTAPPLQTQFAYAVGDAGVVTVDTAGGVLTLVSAVPNAGWSVVEQQGDGLAHIDVKLASASVLVEFRADLVDGQVVPTVESKSLVAPPASGSVSNSSPPNTHDDDDEHDDDDDEHDDDDDSGRGGGGGGDDDD